jgi:hypothetical protein
MTGRWPPTDLPGLHIDMGQRYPTADYRCGTCGWTDSASGDAVAHFVATVHAAHQTQCPNPQKGTP